MKTDFIMPVAFSLDVPNFSDYFGIWQIEESYFRNFIDRCQGMNLADHVRSASAAEKSAKQDKLAYEITKEGIALLSINGPMMKSVSSLSNGTSTVRMRQQLRSAMKSSDVKGAILTMDTPGGTVRGNQDLADEVALFAQSKP